MIAMHKVDIIKISKL